MSAKQTKGSPFPEEKLDFAEQKTEGSIFFTSISYLPFTRLALMPLWHILCPERQRMQNALFYGHGSLFSEYTYCPPSTADYEAIRLYCSSAYTLNKAYTADADDCERLCLLFKIIPPSSAVYAAGKVFDNALPYLLRKSANIVGDLRHSFA